MQVSTAQKSQGCSSSHTSCKKEWTQGLQYRLVVLESSARPLSTRQSVVSVISESKGRAKIMCKQSHSSDTPHGKGKQRPLLQLAE